MTGLLQRLGARATGQAWAVRADTRLPFGAERMAPLPEAVDAAPAEAAAQPHGAPQQRRAGIGTASASAPFVAEAMPRALLPAAHTTQQADPSQTPVTSAATARLQQRPHTPAAPPRSTAHAPDTQPQPVGEPASARTEAPTPAASAAPAAPDAPTPLLPTSASTALRQPHAPHAAWPSAIGAPHGQVAAPQDTEVHIHIGRIDVTALHEAPRAKAKPRERAQPMSLDAYLAKRKGAT